MVDGAIKKKIRHKVNIVKNRREKENTRKIYSKSKNSKTANNVDFYVETKQIL